MGLSNVIGFRKKEKSGSGTVPPTPKVYIKNFPIEDINPEITEGELSVSEMGQYIDAYLAGLAHDEFLTFTLERESTYKTDVDLIKRVYGYLIKRFGIYSNMDVRRLLRSLQHMALGTALYELENDVETLIYIELSVSRYSISIGAVIDDCEFQEFYDLLNQTEY
jgi:hypothetical protein